jgi:transcriptional regulator with XRE-family HTH domain
MDASDLHVQRLLLLIEQLGDEYGRPKRGWQTRVAAKLQLDPSLLSGLLSGKRPGVSWLTITRAAEGAGVDLDFFSKNPHEKKPDHRTYLLKVDMRRPPPAKRAAPLYPDVFLPWVTEAEWELTAEEYDALARLPFTGKPQGWQYSAILSTMRQAVQGRDQLPSGVRRLSSKPPHK